MLSTLKAEDVPYTAALTAVRPSRVGAWVAGPWEVWAEALWPVCLQRALAGRLPLPGGHFCCLPPLAIFLQALSALSG